jgi:hypothetical protein
MYLSVKLRANLSPFLDLKKSIDQAKTLVSLPDNVGSIFKSLKVLVSGPVNSPATVLTLKVRGLDFLNPIIESVKSTR